MTSAHGGDGTRAPRAAVTPLRKAPVGAKRRAMARASGVRRGVAGAAGGVGL